MDVDRVGLQDFEIFLLISKKLGFEAPFSGDARPTVEIAATSMDL